MESNEVLPPNYVLVKYQDNWADEHDVYAIKLMTTGEWDDFKNSLTHFAGCLCFSFGTNQEIDYDDGRDVLSHLTATAINLTVYKDMRDIFGRHTFGASAIFDILEDAECDCYCCGEDEDCQCVCSGCVE